MSPSFSTLNQPPPRSRTLPRSPSPSLALFLPRPVLPSRPTTVSALLFARFLHSSEPTLQIPSLRQQIHSRYPFSFARSQSDEIDVPSLRSLSLLRRSLASCPSTASALPLPRTSPLLQLLIRSRCHASLRHLSRTLEFSSRVDLGLNVLRLSHALVHQLRLSLNLHPALPPDLQDVDHRLEA